MACHGFGFLQPSRKSDRGVVQQPDRRPPVAVAVEWVSKITTVSLEMVLPAVGGSYLDKRLGTNYWTLVGVVLGTVVGLWHLLQMTRPRGGGHGRRGPNDKGGSVSP
jgi:hypothetical protein